MLKLWIIELVTFLAALFLGLLYVQIGSGAILAISVIFGLGSFCILIIIAYKLISAALKA